MVKGNLIQDRVCLDKQSQKCVDDYKMLGVFQTRQLNNLKAGGLVGMGPSAADYRIPLFMDMMKDMGAIKEKVFGFYLTNNMYS